MLLLLGSPSLTFGESLVFLVESAPQVFLGLGIDPPTTTTGILPQILTDGVTKLQNGCALSGKFLCMCNKMGDF